MRELAPNVWQLGGLPPNAINVYLVGEVLVDAGSRWSRRRILRQLRGRKVSQVALTHCHPDHQGAAHAICEQLGVPLACHELDVPSMEGRRPMLPDSRMMRVSTALFAGPPHPVSHRLVEGEELAGFRIIHAPGHTPGHVLLFRERDRVAIAGDVLNTMHLLTTWPGLHEPPWFFSDDPLRNRQSIRELAALRPQLLCAGHGPPLRSPALVERFVERLAREQQNPVPGVAGAGVVSSVTANAD